MATATSDQVDLSDLWMAVEERYSAPHLEKVLASIRANYKRFTDHGGTLGHVLVRSYLICKMKDPYPAGHPDDAAFKVCRCDNGWFLVTEEGRGTFRRCERCLGVTEPPPGEEEMGSGGREPVYTPPEPPSAPRTPDHTSEPLWEAQSGSDGDGVGHDAEYF